MTADQRAHAKAINFGIIYGSSAFGIANQLGIAQAEAQATIDRYFARYRGVRRFLDETMEQARAQGFVRTLLGRRRYLPDLASRNRALRQAAERMAVNTRHPGNGGRPDQEGDGRGRGGARARPASAARMILQVHDELVFEVPRARARGARARSSASAWSRSTPCASPCAWTSGAAGTGGRRTERPPAGGREYGAADPPSHGSRTGTGAGRGSGPRGGLG